MAKVSARKLQLCELRLHFKRKNNNVYRKSFLMPQVPIEGNSKGESHIFDKDLRLFDHEFFILAANERACYYYSQFDFVSFLLALKPIFHR